jgi:hypothetical protein
MENRKEHYFVRKIIKIEHYFLDQLLKMKWGIMHF